MGVHGLTVWLADWVLEWASAGVNGENSKFAVSLRMEF